MSAIATITRWTSASLKLQKSGFCSSNGIFTRRVEIRFLSHQHEDGGELASVFFNAATLFSYGETCCSDCSVVTATRSMCCAREVARLLPAESGLPVSQPSLRTHRRFLQLNLASVGRPQSIVLCSVPATAGCHPRASYSRLLCEIFNCIWSGNELLNLRSIVLLSTSRPSLKLDDVL